MYDKTAHLTAIFDSCDSGTMARGVTATVQRTLPYDDRDVAEDKEEGSDCRHRVRSEAASTEWLCHHPCRCRAG